jgi:hypothetical protein
LASLSTGEVAIFVTLSTGIFGLASAFGGPVVTDMIARRRAPPPAPPDMTAIRAAVRAELEAERHGD